MHATPRFGLCLCGAVAALLLVGLPVTPGMAQAGGADHVIILLDASGSMADRMGREVKIDAAKRAILSVMETVPESTQVGLLVFSSRTGDDWVFPLGERDDARLEQSLLAVEAGGGTPLGAYIKLAADRLLDARKASFGYGSYRLLVVTDGQASDRDDMNRHVQEVIARGIVMDVIGVDMRSHHELATLVHSYRRADDPASLEKALAEILGEVGPGTGDDAGSDEAFAIAAGLPDGAAERVLIALSSASDVPIGQDADYGRAQAELAAVGMPGSPAPYDTTPAQAPGNRLFKTESLVWIIVFLYVFFLFVRKMLRN